MSCRCNTRPLLSCLSPLYLLQMFRLRCERVAGIFLPRVYHRRAPNSASFARHHANAGQWRHNPAVRTRNGSRNPPFPAGASRPGPATRGASTPACSLVVSCGRVTTDVLASPSRFLLLRFLSPRLPVAQFHAETGMSFAFKGLIRLSTRFPQACYQNVWISQGVVPACGGSPPLPRFATETESPCRSTA